jgi:tetratricopeptide (TPR) repeat protein
METLMQQIDFSNHSTRIINLFGPPGFGKSTLAIHVGHAAVRKGVEVHYVNMEEFPDKGVKQVLAKKLLKKGNDVDFEQLLLWLGEYRYWYYQILLIFDNCDDILHNQMGEFHNVLTKIVESSFYVRVLITSREAATLPEYFDWHKVDGISDDAANELLDLKVPKRVGLSPRQGDQIAKLTGNVPIALQIVSSLLRLPNSPSPGLVIEELEKDPIHFLSPKDFPASKQIHASISLSIKYLSPKLLLAGCYLVVFPGSFDEEAAVLVLENSVSQTATGKTILNSLVKSSLLEINIRTLRYQYHRLIREYFVNFVKLYNILNYPERLLSTPMSFYHLHYAEKLMFASNQFQFDHHKSISILYSEHHNFQFLLEFLQEPQEIVTKQFLASTVTVSRAIKVGLFRLRFSTADWCEPIKNAMESLDDMIFYLNLYHYIDRVVFFEYYVLLVTQFAECQEITRGVNGAITVFTDRNRTIEINKWRIRSEDYIAYYEKLATYYSRQDREEDFVECHRKVLLQANIRLAMCNPNQCSNYGVGFTYYKIGENQKAINFLERALKENQTTLDRSRTLVMLFLSYNSPQSDSKDLALSKLLELHDHIMNVSGSELYHADVTQLIINIFRKNGYDREADMLEERLLEVIFEIRAQPQQGAVSMEKAFQFAQHLFDNGNYHKVIDVGTYIMDSLDLETSDDLYLELKVKLLIGKAKFHSGNYSEGMAEIEVILLKVLYHPGSDYMEEKRTSCWYLILRIKYINACYDIMINFRDFFMGTVYLIFQTPLEFQQSISKESATEQGSFSSGPEMKHHSFSQEIATKQAGSIVTTSVRYMEDIMAILLKTIEANIEDELHLLSKSINNLIVFTYSVCSTVLCSLVQIPPIHFLINVACVWIKLWIFYGVCKFIRHPIQCSISIFLVIILTCFGQLRLFIRVLRDPRVRAASKFPDK